MSDSKPPRRPLWQRLLFATSLGLNVLIIGAVTGLVLSGGRDDGTRPPPLRNNGGIAPLVGMLPQDRRDAALAELRQIGKQHGVSHRQLAKDREQVAAVITTEPFDPQAFVAVLDGNQTRFAEYGDAIHLLLADELSRMTPQERNDYAERLGKFGRWRDHSNEHADKRPKKQSNKHESKDDR